MKSDKIYNQNLCKFITHAFIDLHELGSSDCEKLRNLVAALDKNGEISYPEAHKILYPGSELKKAENNIRAFRKRIKTAAELANVEYEIHVSANRKGGQENRKLWISASSVLISSAIDTIRDNPNYDPEKYVENRAVDIHENESNENGKESYTFFISYAHADENQRYNFTKELETNLKDDRINFAFWKDRDILIGKNFETEIEEALNNCDYGLLLISPDFITSDFIKNVEIPPLLEKGILPVGLKNTPFSDLKNLGIEKFQVFTYGDVKTMFYEDTGEDTRIPFFNKLKENIIKRIREDKEKIAKKIKAERNVIRKLQDCRDFADEEGYCYKHYQYILGEKEHFGLKRLVTKDAKSRNIVLDEIAAWQSDETKPPVFALLGDFGTGKTFTTRMLAHIAKNNPGIKPVFYCDLRWTPKSSESRIPGLNNILQKTLETAEIEDIDVNHIKEKFRAGEIIVIFDGLDEKTVYMTDAEAQHFFNELMTIMPQKQEERKKCRLIFTCRSHYFKTVIAQNNFFSGEQRGELGESSFAGMKILMLDEEQIGQYLKKRFPENSRKQSKIKNILQNNESVSDLAKRPYLLSLICDTLPEIKDDEKLNLAGIYNLFVELWYKRDDTKHQLLTRHKEILLNELAMDMWKEGQRSFTISRLEEWLDDWYLKKDKLHHFYIDKLVSNKDFLSDDIRTASFLVRFGESDFRFAHSSLHEFFVARQMISSLKNNDKNMWQSLKPNREILNFFFALWDTDSEKERMETNLLLWLESPDKDINKILFEIWLTLDLPNNHKINLKNVTIKDSKIEGGEYLKDLSFINLENACLQSGEWENINLSSANLTGFKVFDSMLNSIVLDDTGISTGQFKNAHTRKLVKNGKDIFQEQFESKKIKKILNKCNIGFGHNSLVESVAWSPDGCYILSGSRDNSVRIWDADTGNLIRTFSGNNSGVSSVAWSPDGSKILSGSRDNSVRIWDSDTGNLIRTLSGHNSTVYSVAWSPDGSKILSGSSDKSVRIWDADTGNLIRTLSGHNSTVYSVVWSPDGSKILSGSSDNSVRIWDADTGDLINTLSGHNFSVESVTWSPDGSKILSRSSDKSVRIWDADTGDLIRTLSGHNSSVAWSPDGSKILSGSWDNSVRIWEADTGNLIRTLSGNNSPVSSVAWSPDGSKILSGSWDNSVRIWEADTGNLIRTLSGNNSPVSSVAWSPDGSKILSGSWDNSIRIWDADTGNLIRTLSGHNSSAYSVAWSPDGSKILSGSWDNSVRIWEADTGNLIRTLSGHNSSVYSVAWSPDGSKILSGSWDNSVRIWDADTGNIIHTLSGHNASVESVAWSPDGSNILSGYSDNSVGIWDADTGNLIRTLSGHNSDVYSVSWSPDGSKILSGSWDNSVRIWDAETGNLIRTLSGHNSAVNSVAWSPDGSKILSGSWDNSVRIWDADTGNLIRTLNGHNNTVVSVAWSPDGRKILSGSRDNSVRIWDADTGKMLKHIQITDSESYLLLNPENGDVEYVAGNAWKHLYGEALTEDGEIIYFNPEFVMDINGLD